MEGAPEPEMEMESNRPRAPRTASSLPQQESQGRPCWVCVPPDDLGTAGPGLRRKFTDFYGFRMRHVRSKSRTLEEDIRKGEEKLDYGDAVSFTKREDTTLLSSSIEYEELYEVGIQFEDPQGSAQPRTDAWVPINYLMKPNTPLSESEMTSSHCAQQRYAIFSKVFHRWLRRGRPLLIHRKAPPDDMPGPKPIWLSPEHRRTPQNVEEFVDVSSTPAAFPRVLQRLLDALGLQELCAITAAAIPAGRLPARPWPP